IQRNQNVLVIRLSSFSASPARTIRPSSFIGNDAHAHTLKDQSRRTGRFEIGDFAKYIPIAATECRSQQPDGAREPLNYKPAYNEVAAAARYLRPPV